MYYVFDHSQITAQNLITLIHNSLIWFSNNQSCTGQCHVCLLHWWGEHMCYVKESVCVALFNWPECQTREPGTREPQIALGSFPELESPLFERLNSCKQLFWRSKSVMFNPSFKNDGRTGRCSFAECNVSLLSQQIGRISKISVSSVNSTLLILIFMAMYQKK